VKFDGIILLPSMSEPTDIELAKLIRKHLETIGTDWEFIEPFLNRALKPWESPQVLLLTVPFHSEH
jgi:hypothetical protein